MALLSVSDVLLFFTLVLNAIAISKPRGGLVHLSQNFPHVHSEDSFRDTTLNGGESEAVTSDGVFGELLGRARSLLLAFRRCGIFIALWTIALMFTLAVFF